MDTCNDRLNGGMGAAILHGSNGTNFVAGDVNGDGVADFLINLGSASVTETSFML